MNSTTEHVNNSYSSRSETARNLLAAGQDYNASEEVREQAQEELDQLPLSVDRKVLVTITLGYGGPSDWIDAVCSTDGGMLELDTASYTAVWGTEEKTTRLQDSDPLWQLAEHYIEGMEA